ncbi:MAG: hypothetical protein AB7O96_11585 [Pseudobdellovibrionaceae bacterium]
MEESKQINEGLNYILNVWQNWLASMGLDNQSLLVICGVTAVVFVFAFREFAGWYLRIVHTKSELNALRKEIYEMKSLLRDVREDLEFMRDDSTPRKGPALVSNDAAPVVEKTPVFKLD